MVGQTARTMQGTGWLSITPMHIEIPPWMGLWFGVFPTWETIGAQIAAAVFVIGSYYLAREVRVKRPVRRARKADQAATAPAGPGGAGGPQHANGRTPAVQEAGEPGDPVAPEQSVPDPAAEPAGVE